MKLVLYSTEVSLTICPGLKCQIAGILTFISMINTTSESLKARTIFSILVFMSSGNVMLS